MELFVLRHGPAESRDPARWANDELRPLTVDGERETDRAARGLAGLLGEVDRIVSSPAVRARRTAEILRERLQRRTPLVEWPELRPDSEAAPILARAAQAGGRLVLVGHEPTLGELVGYGLTGEATRLLRLSRAGAAALVFPARPVPGAAQLDWAVSRSMLVALGRAASRR